ncbi:LCP family protein [Kitasatospora indigofera]|uniref:LCP family protein n=1 Tax=Kitasatospora indigofera TaxID=67307 RepID=UPI0033AA95C9
MADHEKGRSPRRRALRIAVCAMVAVVVIGAGVAGYAYWKFNGNIKSVDIDASLGTARPPAATDGSFNLLVLGSDSRAGGNGALAGGDTADTARSDTAMVVHVNQDHSGAQVVSVPRDTLVARPACTDKTGKTVPAVQRAMFNSAYETGGAACAVKTAEQLTGLRMNHYIEIDFAGFAHVIDSIGGVTVTTTVAIHDKDSGLDLAAGTHHLDGTQALAFVRTRHGIGNGSDLGRIELQKQMMKSVLQQVAGIGLFSNPVKLWSVGDTLTSSITTDSDLASVNSLVGLAQSLRGIGPEQLAMVTLPVVTAPSDPNRVVSQQPQAGQLWAALKTDQAVPQAVLAVQPGNPATSPSGAATRPPGGSSGTAPATVPAASPSSTLSSFLSGRPGSSATGPGTGSASSSATGPSAAAEGR